MASMLTLWWLNFGLKEGGPGGGGGAVQASQGSGRVAK